MSPSLPPDGLDVLIVNFLCNLAAVTALSPIFVDVTTAADIEALTTALSAIWAL
jgi:hypothetical protein